MTLPESLTAAINELSIKLWCDAVHDSTRGVSGFALSLLWTGRHRRRLADCKPRAALNSILLIGFFVNTLVLRVGSFWGNPSFKELLAASARSLPRRLRPPRPAVREAC